MKTWEAIVLTIHFLRFFQINVQFLKKLLLRLALMLWVMRMRTPATDKGTVTAAMDNATVTAAMDYATVTEDSRTPKP